MNFYSNLIHKSEKVETIQMSITSDEWVNKMWYIHTVEYYSIIKRIKCWCMRYIDKP